MSPNLADSHVHFDRYSPAEIEGMLARARAAGVRHFLAIGVDLASSAAAVALAQSEPDVRAAIGVHPTRLTHDVDVAELRRLASIPGVVAIGEVGFDDGPRAPSPELQRAFFAQCLDLAAERGLAVALHTVGLHAEAQHHLASAHGVRTVVHYFQGDADLAQRYLALGCWISVGKPVTRPERAELRAALRSIPLERLMLETDTYPLPGRLTEPRDVVEICRAVAKLRGVPVATVAEATTANYLCFIGQARALN